MRGHLTDDELIDHLYGLDAPAECDSHLLSCADCTDKLQLFEQRRTESVAVPLAGSEEGAFLAAQRNQIRVRVDQRPLLAGMGLRRHWVPALLAGVLVAAAVLVPRIHPGPAKVSEKAVKQEVAEDQLFREAFSLAAAEEPRAAAPIRGLFESGAGEQQ